VNSESATIYKGKGNQEGPGGHITHPIITNFGEGTFGTTALWNKGLAIVLHDINSFSSKKRKAVLLQS